MKYGLRYRIARVHKLLTSDKLAKRTGCHVSVIEALESGYYVPPKIRQRIDEILKVKNG
jgi:ribosome-binding protein aMBF1 (putative translation factor)